MFNRWTAGKQAALRGEKARRPYLASECKDLNSADKWRQDILREIGKKVMDIQNAGLGEHRIRDLNDEINKLIREKHHWEKRILQLGGPNYISQGRRIADEEKGEVVGRPGGYQYFGAAKNLPGVKELFEKPKPRTVRRSRAQMLKCIDLDYYGMLDEEDGTLVKLEAEAEEKLRAKKIAEWEAKQREIEAITGKRKHDGDGDDGVAFGSEFVAHVPLPDNKDIEALVLAKKKKDLLAKYASEELQAEEAEAKSMLNKAP